jgi:protein-disulfide isomerase-like protein with CxxC motif
MHLHPEEEDVDIWYTNGKKKANTQINQRLVLSVGLQQISFMNMKHILYQV